MSTYEEDRADVLDNPEWTAEDFARAKSFAETLPDLAAKMGAAQETKRKVAISIRLDAAVIEHFKAGGRGWQSRINAALAEFVRQQSDTEREG